MKVVVDAMGSDQSPVAQVEGVLQALDQFPSLQVILAGPADLLETQLKSRGRDVGDRLSILNSAEVILPEEEPVRAIRQRKGSSMVQGLRRLARGEAQAVVSAGNTGALLAGGLFIAGRIRGVRRPALATVLPTLDQNGTLFLDLGASVDSRADDLVQHALMGAVYAREILGRRIPRVGLLNVGTEDQKGNLLVRDAHVLLKELDRVDMEFVGNLEARDIFSGEHDVIVSEGFVGNVALKVIEGTAKTLMEMLRSEIGTSWRYKLGGLVLRPAVRGVYSRMDYTEYGGAPLLGLREIVIKCHGSSNGRAFFNGIRQALFMAERRVPERIASYLERGAACE